MDGYKIVVDNHHTFRVDRKLLEVFGHQWTASFYWSVEILLELLALCGTRERGRGIVITIRKGLTVAFKHVRLAALLFHSVWVIDRVLQHLVRNAELSRLISRYFTAVIGL